MRAQAPPPNDPARSHGCYAQLTGQLASSQHHAQSYGSHHPPATFWAEGSSGSASAYAGTFAGSYAGTYAGTYAGPVATRQDSAHASAVRALPWEGTACPTPPGTLSGAYAATGRDAALYMAPHLSAVAHHATHAGAAWQALAQQQTTMAPSAMPQYAVHPQYPARPPPQHVHSMPPPHLPAPPHPMSAPPQPMSAPPQPMPAPPQPMCAPPQPMSAPPQHMSTMPHPMWGAPHANPISSTAAPHAHPVPQPPYALPSQPHTTPAPPPTYRQIDHQPCVYYLYQQPQAASSHNSLATLTAPASEWGCPVPMYHVSSQPCGMNDFSPEYLRSGGTARGAALVGPAPPNSLPVHAASGWSTALSASTLIRTTSDPLYLPVRPLRRRRDFGKPIGKPLCPQPPNKTIAKTTRGPRSSPPEEPTGDPPPPS